MIGCKAVAYFKILAGKITFTLATFVCAKVTWFFFAGIYASVVAVAARGLHAEEITNIFVMPSHQRPPLKQ